MILRQSQVPHAWRTAWAYTALTIWLMLAVYWLMNGPLLWLLRLPWWGEFSWGTVST